MEKERLLTCIVCPRGCQMRIGLDGDGKILSIEGNLCKRGAIYATDECTAPKRTVTSTVRCASGGLASVKTDRPIPKELIFECMKEINSATAPGGVKIGDVIIPSVLGTDANVVATSGEVN